MHRIKNWLIAGLFILASPQIAFAKPESKPEGTPSSIREKVKNPVLWMTVAQVRPATSTSAAKIQHDGLL